MWGDLETAAVSIGFGIFVAFAIIAWIASLPVPA